MPKQYGRPNRPTTPAPRVPSKKLAAAFLAILLTLSIWQTKSYATVVQVSDNAVQMTATDLRTLITEIQTNKAAASALRESLETERAAYGAYEASVTKLIAAQEQERADAMAVIKQLKRQLDAPALEIYTGYDTNEDWEAGIRLVFRLN